MEAQLCYVEKFVGGSRAMLVLQAIAPADDLKPALDKLETDLAAVRRKALNA